MNIKAIETSYGGYRFRSRLEARWAVFFDSMKWEWEYEKEGFNLGGICYLPDFWLPKIGAWAEVKPERLKRIEREKCQALADLTESPVILLVGPPEVKAYRMLFMQRPDAFLATNVVLTIHSMGTIYDCMHGLEPEDIEPDYFPDVKQAVIAAKSARFEFGEKGIPA